MARDYDNNMTGVLFKNERKRSDKDPGYTGSAEIDGVEFWLSAWLNESDKRGKYFKIKFKPKDDDRNERRSNNSSNRRPVDDEDIPF